MNEENKEITENNTEFVIKGHEEEPIEEIYDDEPVKEKNVIKDLLPYIFILIIVILIRTFIATPVRVHGPSMQPTLNGGETMMLIKLGEIKRFDIVVIKTQDEHLIKRVIGLPGEKVEIVNSKIYINDEPIADNYGSGKTSSIDPIVLGTDEYYVLGDNRENSTDSRILGPIKEMYIEGKTSFVVFPLNKLGNVN